MGGISILCPPLPYLRNYQYASNKHITRLETKTKKSQKQELN